MGIGDIGVSLWGECEHQDGMHLGARGFVHAELIDPASGAARELADGAEGELVLTHLRHRAAPLLRFRTRDHVEFRIGACACGRTAPRVRCIGRTDDMLIVRGVNVFPSAVREVVSAFAPGVSGQILVRPTAAGVKQEPPLPVSVELAEGAAADAALADSIRERLREALVVQTEVELVPWRSLSAASTSRSWSSAKPRRAELRKLQSQGVHHITIVGADRQTSIDFWEGVLGMPFVFEQPNLDNEAESHLYFDPGDGRLITSSPTRSASPTPSARRPTPAAFTTSPSRSRRPRFRQAVERLDERGIQHSGVKDRGFMDSIYFEDPLGLLIELASYRFEPPARLHPRRRAARGAQDPGRARRLQHRPDPPRRRDRGPRRPLTRVALGRPFPQGPVQLQEKTMAANTLSMLMPSVNNLSARIFVRAAGLDFEEVDVWGKTTTPEFLAKDPAHLTPLLEEDGPAARVAVGELRDHAVPLQQARARPPLPDRSGRAGDDRQRDVLFDRHVLSARRPRDLPDARLPAVRRARSRPPRPTTRSRRRPSRTPRRRSPSRSRPTARSSSRAAVHRRRLAVDRRHPAGGDARVPARDRLRLPGLGRGVHGRGRGRARRRLLRARGRRPRLRRLGQVGVDD